MILTTYPYTTIHAYHRNPTKPITNCKECQALQAQHEEAIELMVDQGIEDHYHSHGRR